MEDTWSACTILIDEFVRCLEHPRGMRLNSFLLGTGGLPLKSPCLRFDVITVVTLKITLFLDVASYRLVGTPCMRLCSTRSATTLKLDAVHSYETLAHLYQITRRHMKEECILQEALLFNKSSTVRIATPTDINGLQGEWRLSVKLSEVRHLRT
jgi:hypothetical protein